MVWALKHFRAYLLCHHTIVFTDHAALKSLLNTPHPSGKLARWGMAIQEIHPEIRYQSGKANTNADCLSRAPVGALPIQDTATANNIPEVMLVDSSTQNSEDGRPTRKTLTPTEKPEKYLRTEGPNNVSADLSDPSCLAIPEVAREQQNDSKLREIIEYIQLEKLPEDQQRSKRLVLEHPRFDLVDGVLYFCDTRPPYRMCLAIPENLTTALLAEAHSGQFAGHFAEKSLFGVLSRRYC